MTNSKTRKLDPRLDGDYVMVKLLPGQVRFKGVLYDTRVMDTITADRLIQAGATFIKKKKKRTGK